MLLLGNTAFKFGHAHPHFNFVISDHVRFLTKQPKGLLGHVEVTDDSNIPRFSSRAMMLCDPGLAADTSNVPESISSSSDRDVSKLLFNVVAITPVGPVFSQPLQYKPRGNNEWPDILVKVIKLMFTFRTVANLPLEERVRYCLAWWICGNQTAEWDRWGGFCSQYCWWPGHRKCPPLLQ